MPKRAILKERKDGNHKDIVKAFREYGAYVHNFGPLDILVGFKGSWGLVEIKDGNKTHSKRKLTEKEIMLISEIRNRAPVYIAEGICDVIKILSQLEGISHD